MPSAESGLKEFFQTLSAPTVLAEILAIVIAGLIGLAAAQVARSWYRRHPAAMDQKRSGGFWV